LINKDFNAKVEVKQFDNHQPLLVCYLNTFGKTVIAKGYYGKLQLKLSLAGIDTPEDKLSELQNWL